MQAKESKANKILAEQKRIEDATQRIKDLENREMEMLQNLRGTVNEHAKLLTLAKNGNLDEDDEKSVMESVAS